MQEEEEDQVQEEEEQVHEEEQVSKKINQHCGSEGPMYN